MLLFKSELAWARNILHTSWIADDMIEFPVICTVQLIIHKGNIIQRYEFSVTSHVNRFVGMHV